MMYHSLSGRCRLLVGGSPPRDRVTTAGAGDTLCRRVGGSSASGHSIKEIHEALGKVFSYVWNHHYIFADVRFVFQFMRDFR